MIKCVILKWMTTNLALWNTLLLILNQLQLYTRLKKVEAQFWSERGIHVIPH